MKDDPVLMQKMRRNYSSSCQHGWESGMELKSLKGWKTKVMVGGDGMGNVEESGKYTLSDIAVLVCRRGTGGNSHVNSIQFNSIQTFARANL